MQSVLVQKLQGPYLDTPLTISTTQSTMSGGIALAEAGVLRLIIESPRGPDVNLLDVMANIRRGPNQRYGATNWVNRSWGVI